MCGAVTYQRISKASFLDVASQVSSQETSLGAVASGAHGGLMLLYILLSGCGQQPPGSSVVLCTQLSPFPWPLHTRFITSSPKHKTMTSTVEVECEAQSRCRGSVCGGGQPALPTLSVSPLAQSSGTRDFLQPHWANMSVGCLRPLIRVGKGQRSQIPLASTLPDFGGSAQLSYSWAAMGSMSGIALERQRTNEGMCRGCDCGHECV